MLTEKEFELLVLLTEQNGRCSQRQLAERLGCSPGTVNKMLKAFLSAGYYDGTAI